MAQADAQTYAGLPTVFFSHLTPTPVREPRVAIVNHALARTLGLDPDVLDSPQGARILSGNELPDGARPLAQAYAGHQYARFVMLGDGRALLLGEHLTPDGRRVDIQLKGSGPTPYSRGGDGRAALGPMLREYVISEAMHALGVATTRSLAVVTTGETVYRQTPQRGAILTRVAASHLRVGTFEYAASLADPLAVKALADYAIARHYPEAMSARNPYLAFLNAVSARQALLIAQWQAIGFIHGVMNTDNMAISGETIDYGPCAFLDEYDPAAVFSAIDRYGRYAFGNQPAIAQWNLARLAETLLPLLDEDAHEDPQAGLSVAQDALRPFLSHVRAAWLGITRAKLGLFNEEDDDDALAQNLLTWMRDQRADFTNTWRALISEGQLQSDDLFQDAGFLAWRTRWEERRRRQTEPWALSAARMRAASPAIIPRNHAVEAALTAWVERQNEAPFKRLLAALAAPYDDPTPDAQAQNSEDASLRRPPTPQERVHQTFCGT
ncbi:MAG: YdiU family protein [Vampirovibrionales bacterium]|nr:YdiU family protein [Vampirovibrionales bacterium]